MEFVLLLRRPNYTHFTGRTSRSHPRVWDDVSLREDQLERFGNAASCLYLSPVSSTERSLKVDQSSGVDWVSAVPSFIAFFGLRWAILRGVDWVSAVPSFVDFFGLRWAILRAVATRNLGHVEVRCLNTNLFLEKGEELNENIHWVALPYEHDRTCFEEHLSNAEKERH